jgi:hypothetical protein
MDPENCLDFAMFRPRAVLSVMILARALSG